jgi:hypothetical protein
VAALPLLACGRSEHVGWENREQPDSVARVARAAAVQESLEAGPAAQQARARTYQALLRSLEPIQRQAMRDPELAALWEQLANDVEARVASNSEFHAGLLQRREEIEALIGPGADVPDTLTEEQKAELVRHHRNIQTEMARAQSIELKRPEFFPRLREFRAVLFDEMREIAPGRASDIDRLEELEEELLQEEPTNPVPNMQPAR